MPSRLPRFGLNPTCASCGNFALITSSLLMMSVATTLYKTSPSVIPLQFLGSPRSPFFGKILSTPNNQLSGATSCSQKSRT